VSSFTLLPVFKVPAGSKSITDTSCPATGLCSTPLGIMINSFSLILAILSLNSISSVPCNP
jgi:hypothetical protein